MFGAGVIGLVLGSDLAIAKSQIIAKKFGVSELLIGLTVISIGSSLPEIATNVTAGIAKSAGTETSGIAIGNIIGSEVAQITIILGIVGLIALIKTDRRSLKRDGLMLFAAIAAMFFAAMDGTIFFLEGLFLVLIYLAYMYVLFKKKETPVEVKTEETKSASGFPIDFFLLVVGLITVIIASNLVVSHGVAIARARGVSEMFIGLLVGLGTSFPELTLSIRALSKGAVNISLGNLIGSNITDPLFSLGLGALALGNIDQGFTVESPTLLFDFPFWFLCTALALLFMWRKSELNRFESILLIALYFVFMGVKFFTI